MADHCQKVTDLSLSLRKLQLVLEHSRTLMPIKRVQLKVFLSTLFRSKRQFAAIIFGLCAFFETGILLANTLVTTRV